MLPEPGVDVAAERTGFPQEQKLLVPFISAVGESTVVTVAVVLNEQLPLLMVCVTVNVPAVKKVCVALTVFSVGLPSPKSHV